MAAYAIGVNNQPYMKPAVGPKKIAIPPRPPVNTGKPNAANANNIPIVIVAGRVGKQHCNQHNTHVLQDNRHTKKANSDRWRKGQANQNCQQ